MSRLAVFDLDGVLADTRATVRAAYREVGVEMPDDAWGRPWTEWLVDAVGGDVTKAESLHSQKTVEYRRLLRTDGVVELPAGTVARELGDRAVVVTSSARSSALLILDSLWIPLTRLVGAYLDLNRRVDIISYLASCNGGDVVYLDDLATNCEYVTLATNLPSHHVIPQATVEVIREWTR